MDSPPSRIQEQNRGARAVVQERQVVQPEGVEEDGSKPRRRALIGAAIVVLLSAIIIGSVLGTRDDPDTTTRDKNTSSDITTRLTTFSNLLVTEYKVSSQTFQDTSSPQYQALLWMVDKDSTDLQSTLSDDELVERFALVLFHFSTGGESWLDQAGFLNPLINTCSWKSVYGGAGVDCNDKGSVTTLDLCKFPKLST
jgi:hypothetical protein